MKRCNIWVYYLIPIAVHLLFLLPWFLINNWMVSLIEIFIGTVVIPIYLITISNKLLDNFGTREFFVKLVIMLGITILGIVISYFNWGITTGNLLNPDSETIYILKLEMVISSIIVIVSWIIIYFTKTGETG